MTKSSLITKNTELKIDYAEIAREYFKSKKVYRYHMKKISDMTDEEVIQKCHFWQEEHGMVYDYRAFVERFLK